MSIGQDNSLMRIGDQIKENLTEYIYKKILNTKNRIRYFKLIFLELQRI